MIDVALGFIREQLDDALRSRFSVNDEMVVLSAITALDGNIDAGIANRVVLTLVNIEREAMVPALSPTPDLADVSSRALPRLNLNFDLLISSPFRQYTDSLKYLSAVLDFFHDHPLFSPENSPDLTDRAISLSLEMENLDRRAMNDVWSLRGGNYYPSVVYKVRLMPSQTP